MASQRRGLGLLAAIALTMSVAATGSASSGQKLTQLDWTSQTYESRARVTGIAYGDGRFVATHEAGMITLSHDGQSWDEVHQEPRSRDPGITGGVPGVLLPTLNAVTYASGRFVAVGKPYFLVLTSTTGETWDFSYEWPAERIEGYTELVDVTYGAGRFVAVGNNGPNSRTIASPDGVNWSHSDVFPNTSLEGVAYGHGLFVAVGKDSHGHGLVMVSADGHDWTPVGVSLPPLFSIVFSNDQFFAAGWWPDGDRSAYVFKSGDGRSWTGVPAPIGATRLMAAGGFLFQSGSGVDQPAPLAVSRDGEHWLHAEVPAGIEAIAAAEDKFVAGGSYGTMVTLSPCAGFLDVAAGLPACKAVAFMQARGILSGYPDGTFRPAAPVTRAEFAKMLVLTVGTSPQPGASVAFPDAADHWSAPLGYIQAAVAMNAIAGYPDGTFRPDAPVTRAELLRMVTSAAGLPADPVTVTYDDVTERDWFAESVKRALGARLIGAEAAVPIWSGATLDPARPATRAETASVLANLAQQMSEMGAAR